MISRLRGRLIVLLTGGAALLPAGLLAIAMSRSIGSPEAGAAGAGFETAAGFTLPTLGGGSFVLSDHAGQPAFLYFWASWCGPGRREAPLIEARWPEYRAAGYTFVGVNILDSEADARAFFEELGLTFPMALDANGDVYLEYGIYGIPEAFFLRPGLLVHEKFIGELNEQRFRDRLDALPEGS